MSNSVISGNPAHNLQAQALAESKLALFQIDGAGRIRARNELFAQQMQASFGSEATRGDVAHRPGTLRVQTPLDRLMRSVAEGPCVCDVELYMDGATRGISALLWAETRGSAHEPIEAQSHESAGESAREHNEDSQAVLQGIVLRSALATDLEAARAQHTELEFITKVAGALAHDFNNLLTVVMSVGELMLLSGELGAGLTQRTRTLIAATQRAACLATQLSHLTRKPTQPPPQVPSEQLLQGVLRLLRQIAPELEIKTRLQGDQGMLRLDLDPLTQVLIQLILHLRDSLPTESPLVLTMRRVFFAEGLANALSPGAYTEISLCPDTANASPTSDLASQLMSMAEPPGRRSGLGLTSAQDIVTHAGGYVALLANDSAATLFVVYLPLSEA